MKKLIAILLCMLMLVAVAACKKVPEQTPAVDAETQSDPETPAIGKVGGWTIAADTALTDELKAIFEKALEELVGVDYVPVALLGTQVVAGTNYCFLTQGTVVYPDAVPQFKLVYVYKNLEGGVKLLNIVDLPVVPNEDGTVSVPSSEAALGGWTYESDPAISDELRAELDKAFEGLLGADYLPIANLASQVVNGTNRCILCKVTPVVPNPVPHYALVYCYASADGDETMTYSVDFDLDMPEDEPVAEANFDEPLAEEKYVGDEPEFVPADEPLAGGWAIAEDPAMTDERRAIFDKAIEGIVGVEYKPIACLGTQVVAGTNYCFLAQSTAVTPDAMQKYVLVYVYADLGGGVQVMNFADMPVIPNEYGTAEPIPMEETLDGGWAYAESPEITDEIKASLEKALESLAGVDYEPIANLGTQIVAGTNRCLLCRITPVTPNPVPHYALVYVYEALDGASEITDVFDFDFGALCTYGA